MEITPAVPAGRQVIESYGAGRFTVSGTVHRGALLVRPGRTSGWPLDGTERLSLEASTLESLAPLWLDEEPATELLLIGCGPRPAPISPELRAGLRTHGIVVEAIDTGAACRTYNVLLAEGRRVAAALLPVE